MRAHLHLPLLVENVTRVLARAEAELRVEQASHGLDAKKEVAIQALLADGLRASYATDREVYYPSSSGLPRERARCDFALRPIDDLDATPLWVELKVAHQLRPEGRRNARYAQQWRTSTLDDLRKLRTDPKIEHAAFLLVAYNDEHATAEKDLVTFERLLDGVEPLAGFVSTASIAIQDRIGHAVCTVAAWPVI